MIATTAALLAAALLQVTEAQRGRVAWVPNPRVTNGTWVADPANHLGAAAVATLNSEIAALEAATGAEIAVVVVDSTSGLDPFDFALALHRVWGVGKRGVNNGVLLLWVPTQRAVWISVGQGLEGVIPDRLAGRIRDEDIFPAFRNEDFDGGMIAGVRALAAAARGEARAEPVVQDDGGVSPLEVVGGVGGGAAALLGTGIGYRRYRRRKPRLCPNGHGRMRLLDESADDEHLDGGERLEENYKSVDYDVWLCDTCGHTQEIAYKSWFSKYRDCPECRRRTLKVSEKTLRSATTTSTGLKRVNRSCGNCGFKDSKEVAIPRVTSSSSSGSGGSSSGGGGGGGGSSFGGGSSGGGGAGGRY